MTVRIGVIGSGFGARVVAPVFDATDGCTVVDVVSARDEHAIADLCARPDVDLVSVHSPPFLHAAHVRAALDGGHAVLCDKPFGLDAGDAELMLDAADASGRVNLVNFELRRAPLRERLRAMILDGAIGRPEHVQWTHLSAGSRVPLRPHGWLFERRLGGGWIGAWGAHAIDTVRWTFGEVTGAHAECRVTITERPDRAGVPRPCDAEDAFTATLRTSPGCDRRDRHVVRRRRATGAAHRRAGRRGRARVHRRHPARSPAGRRYAARTSRSRRRRAIATPSRCGDGRPSSATRCATASRLPTPRRSPTDWRACASSIDSAPGSRGPRRAARSLGRMAAGPDDTSAGASTTARRAL